MFVVSTDGQGPQYGGSGDPKRSIELLWGVEERPRRGPKPRLTIERIAQTAIELADAEGLPALSMRQVAGRLGVGTMSLYTYVPGKAELIDVMLDRVYGELTEPEETGGWRERLAGIARANWELILRHRWMTQIATSRPALGPNATAHYEFALRAIDGIGLSDLEMDAVLSLVLGHAEAFARREIEAVEAERHTGMTDDEWWRERAPLLDKVMDPERFPIASRVGQAAGAAYGAAYDFRHGFEFGLQRLLDGIELLLSGRAS